MTWLLPTRGRPQNLRRFLNAARENGTSGPGLVVFNREDWEQHRPEYELAKRLAPEGWEYQVVEAASYGDAMRAVWPLVEHDDWIGLVSDDLVPCSGAWDKTLIASLQGWNFVSSNDGWQARQNVMESRMHGATVWSGPLLRAVGYIFPPTLKHVFHDDLWETIGRESGCWQMRMDVMVKHLHESLDGIRGPTMDPTSDLWRHDEAVFKEWKEKELPGCLARIREVQAHYNVRTVKADFTGVNLMIGTPTIDGKYEAAYMTSLFRTFHLMQGNNAGCFLAEEKYTADIALARSKIFAAFVRTDATHLLMIDADMGWSDDAILRLFCAKKDFVAVAGPKKRYPLQFAANYTDEKGNPVPLMFDQETGTMEIGEIGSAFCLVTKAMALKMINAYSELEYVGITGEKEWGLFMPMIVNHRWYSEDFAFCKRWRNIGGKLYFCPDVSLTHTGAHSFSGSFMQSAKPAPAQLQEAAD